MTGNRLTDTELVQLIQKVFQPSERDSTLYFLLDLPNANVPDDENWRDRRQLVYEWTQTLDEVKSSLGLDNVDCFYYENVGSNNADLPGNAFVWFDEPGSLNIALLKEQGKMITFEQVFSKADIVLVPSKFSATAPLKNLAKRYDFRAASMPGFTRDMVPALGLDYEKVHERVMYIKSRLDRANAIDMVFGVGGQKYNFHVDSRQRLGHASSGLLRDRGMAGNLPSGESYIVPYEGELQGKSETSGQLPVQFGDEIVLYEIVENRAVSVLSAGKISDLEKERLRQEPAYGNIAEIGFGVLQPFGIKPVGEGLLDEKLGLHVAFGRSDHFGGATSPVDFKNPENVVHIDRIYIPDVQPKVNVVEVIFRYLEQADEIILKNGRYVV